MDTQSILDKISNYKSIIESENDPELIAKFKKKIDVLEAQIAEAEKKIEKEEKKIEAEEKKELSEVETKIQNLKDASATEDNPVLKAKFEKKIKELEDSLKDVKEEIKEEKKEVAEQKKEIKEAIKKVKSSDKVVRKTAIKKVKEVATEVKKTVTKKKKRKTKLKTIMSQLDALINKNKKLKSKYTTAYKKSGKTTDVERDSKRKAKPFGYRFVGKHDYRVPTQMQIKRGLKRGTIDYEARPNRSDYFPDRKVKLADGGEIYKMADSMTDAEFQNNFKKLNKEQKRVYDFLVNTGDTPKLALATVLLSKKEAWSEDTIKAYTMADGGYMAKGGEMDKVGKVKVGDTLTATTGVKVKVIEYDPMFGGRVKVERMDEYATGKPSQWMPLKNFKMEKGGMMADGGMTSEKYVIEKQKDGTYLIFNTERNMYVDHVFETKGSAEGFKKEKDVLRKVFGKETKEYQGMADGGMMARGGRVKKVKVGYTKEDKARKAKPSGWRWKEEAYKKRIIEKKQLYMNVSAKNRAKYPDLVYYEDRLNKSDKNPSTKYQSV
jgi:hypothetical protein